MGGSLPKNSCGSRFRGMPGEAASMVVGGGGMGGGRCDEAVVRAPPAAGSGEWRLG